VAGLGANVAKGRETELYQRVLDNDPTDSAFIMLILAVGGAALTSLQDAETVDDVLNISDEVTNAGYARAEFVDADLDPIVVDNTRNQILLSLPLHTFGSPNIAAGDVWDIACIAFGTSGTFTPDTDLMPIVFTEVRIEGTAIPGIGQPIIVDFSGGFAVAT
jgi:hypothetical protein